MNTLEPTLTDNRGNLKVDRALISRTSRRTPVRSSIRVVRKKHWQLKFSIILMPLGAIALIVYKLRAVPADVLRQEFEGFGVAICVVASGVILLWRVIHSLAIEQSYQTQLPAVKPAPVSPSEPNPAEPQKIQSSLPPEATTAPAAPVASLPIETRI